MTLRWLFATLHLLALPLGLAAIWLRARALRGTLDATGLRRVFATDLAWGLAAILWIGTGLMRAFGGLEKGSAYYLEQPVFHAKLGLLVAIIALEAWPAATLTRWRRRVKRGEAVDAGRASALARISEVQTVLVILMVAAATALARGLP